MAIYYCHDCAPMHWPAVPPDHTTTNLTGSTPTSSTYLLGKFMKHSMPPPLSGGSIVSVFSIADYPTYRDYVVNAMASGSTEVDDQGRRNVVWYAGKNIGVTYSGSAFTASSDTVKVVLAHDSTKVHAFPVESGPLRMEKCADCDRDIIV